MVDLLDVVSVFEDCSIKDSRARETLKWVMFLYSCRNPILSRFHEII